MKASWEKTVTLLDVLGLYDRRESAHCEVGF